MIVVCVFVCLFECYGDHRDLHSFPTRRSSDLLISRPRLRMRSGGNRLVALGAPRGQRRALRGGLAAFFVLQLLPRSEEHTSELQSQSNLVCRLLLEKKK